MPTHNEHIKATATLLERNQKLRAHWVTIVGRKFLVGSNVFSPRIFNDTELFAAHIPVIPGEYFCEIGCGCGAVGITAAYKGARKVLLLDINPNACLTTRKNIALHGLQNVVEVRRSNIFSGIGRTAHFDTVFWNTPFDYTTASHLSLLELSVFDPYYRATKRFITQGSQRAERLLIGFSSTLGRLDLLSDICGQAGRKLKLVYSEWSKEILPVKFEIFEAKKL